MSLEGVGYLLLRYSDPTLAGRISKRHPFLSVSQTRTTLHFHPLWGWGGARRPPGSGWRAGFRDPYGFTRNDLEDSTVLDASADVRIFVLGGSTVRGVPHPVRHSIPSYLERELEARFDLNFNVVNAGYGDWTSVNELAFLVHKILPFFDPDAVILLDGANDARRATSVGRSLADNGGSPPRSILFHPTLKRYKRQFDAIQYRPEFALNQFLHTLGLRKYFEANRYYIGGWLDSVGLWPSSDRSRPLVGIRRFWRDYSLSASYEARADRRIQSLTILRRSYPMRPKWRKKQLQYVVGLHSDTEWDRTRAWFRGINSRKKRAFFENIRYLFPYREIKHGSGICRTIPIDTGSYVANVRSALGAAQAQSVPILHALQPTLVFKQSMTARETVIFARTVTRGLVGTEHRFASVVGMCWHRIFRRFYREAEARLRDEQFSGSTYARHVNFSHLLAGDRQRRFTDFVHYTRKGHEIIAEELANRVADMRLWTLER